MAAQKVNLYGLAWDSAVHPLEREFFCIRHGGRWKGKKSTLGNGMEFHFRQALKLTWPNLRFNAWLDMFIREFLTKRTIGVIGPASSGKSFDAAICGLMDYYIFPTSTTGIYCSTTRELLQQRIFGEVVGLHKEAIRHTSWLPGHLIESRLRIVTVDHDSESEIRDVRSGLLGVPCRQGESWIGISAFVGIKNKRVRLYGDELSMLPKAFVEAISNLDKNPDFKCVGMGNPKDTTDALGILCEPSAQLGGWEGGIDQHGKSQVWETRRPQGVCIQFVGTDSPNLDGKLGIPLITQEAIDRDISFYGKDSIQFTMMNQGMMPRGQGSRRVLTRQMIDKFGAKDSPDWLNSNRVKGASLDAAYRSVGGDRCVLKFWEFGEEIPKLSDLPNRVISALTDQPKPLSKKRNLFAMTETVLVPIKTSEGDPEDQIAKFVMDECVRRGVPPEHFFFDSGMRTSLVHAFSRLWSNNVQSIDCGGKPTERPVSYDIDVKCSDHYSKFISELWFSVRLAVEARQFRGMTEGEITEFCGREWGIVGANKTEVEPKADMKKKTGRSPDEADCVAIALEGAKRLGFTIRRLESARRVKPDDGWKTDLRDKATTFWKSGSLTYS